MEPVIRACSRTPDKKDNNDNRLSTHVLLEKHSKAVSALTVDPSGSRMVTGSYDDCLKYWDFHGMNHRGASFRHQEDPTGSSSYPIKQVSFSKRGDRVLVISGCSTPRILTRDGVLLNEFPRGDPYLLDKRKTLGHQTSMTTGQWSPLSDDIFMSSSLDGTIRIWDVCSGKQESVVIVGKGGSLGGGVSHASWSTDPGTIIIGASNGIVKGWPSSGPFHRPSFEICSAHSSSSVITCTLLKDTILLTRSTDATLKVWDVRKIGKDAVKIFDNLPCDYEETDIIYSPSGNLFSTGSSCIKDKKSVGTVYFFDSHSLELIPYQFDDDDDDCTKKSSAGVVRLLWHPKIDQLIAGRSDGSVAISYEENSSSKGGILLSLNKKKSTFSSSECFSEMDVDLNASIMTPHSLPLFKEPSKNLKRMRERQRADPIASHRPEQPVASGPGKGGRIGSNVSQHIMKHIIQDRSRDEDPREALLKYAKAAQENPMFIAPAYSKTQPKPIFSHPDLSDHLQDDPQQTHE